MSSTTTITNNATTQSQSQSGTITLQPSSNSDIHTKLIYSLEPADGSRPYNYAYAPTEDGDNDSKDNDSKKSVTSNGGFTRTDLVPQEHDAVIKDIRQLNKENNEVGLDITGFDWINHQTKVAYEEFAEDKSIEEKYYPEVIELLKKFTGAHTVQIFDHTVRRGAPPGTTVVETPRTRQPVTRVHVDQTPTAATNRVKRHLPAEKVDELLKGRYWLINVWRPLVQVFDSPLVVGDWRTIEQKNLLPTDLIYADRTGETYTVTHNPNQQFWSLSQQKPDEVLFIKCFDSKPGAALLTPHTAFRDPRYFEKEGIRPRESIEIRCLVFQDK